MPFTHESHTIFCVQQGRGQCDPVTQKCILTQRVNTATNVMVKTVQNVRLLCNGNLQHTSTTVPSAKVNS